MPYRNSEPATAEVEATPGGNATTRDCSPAGGLFSVDLEQERGVVAHPAGHTDEEIAAACRALLSESKRHEDHACARELLGMLEV